MENLLQVRNLGLIDYRTTYDAMVAFTECRDETTPDELWLLQHEAVFTQGRAGKDEHLLSTGNIPVIQSDRGGQVTYHGPGQLTAYVLMDLKRRKIGVRDLVSGIEQTIIDTLSQFGIKGYAKADAPGVYVADGKIASLGLRIRQGRSFHGLALNVNMNMEPFQRINPCGYAGMTMIQMNQLSEEDLSVDVVSRSLMNAFKRCLGYQVIDFKDEALPSQAARNE